MIGVTSDKTQNSFGRRVTQRLAALAFSVGLRLCQGVGLGATLGLVAAPVRAEPLVLTHDGMVQTAVTLLERGHPEQALRFANALLQQNPEDATALIIKARAERDLARYQSSVATARLAWKTAGLQRERYGAALAMAQGLASDGQKFRAQFWLRRAIEEAPDEGAKRLAEKDFVYVKSRSRLGLKFDLAIQPSSNVNNGSSSDVLWFMGLPFVLSEDAKALSGVTTTLGISGHYRLAETQTSKTDLRFSLGQRMVTLSGSAKATAPAARGSDYAFTTIEVGLDRYLRPGPKDEVQLGVTLGRNWYGGDPMSHYLGANALYRRDLTPTVRGFAEIGAERQWREDVAERSADVMTLSFGLDTVTANRDRLRFEVTARDTASGSSDIDHRGWGASLDWTRSKPVLKGRLSLGLSAEGRDYAVSKFSADGRHDLTVGATMSMAFEGADYMGFIPVLSVQSQRTSSNVSLYDSQSTGIGLSVQSKF